MKKLITTLAILAIALGCVFAAHWTPAWWGQNPYMAMNIYVYGAQVDGLDLAAGDEIGVFDGSTLVGAATLTGPITTNVPIIVSTDGGDVPGSAVPGNFITFKVWKSPSGPEYEYPAMSVQFAPPYVTEFEALGTTHVVMLSYQPPAAGVTQTLTPPEGPGGGYVTDIEYSGTGFTIDQIWINADGGGDLSGYYIPDPPLDLSFVGTPPAHVSIYEWDFDLLTSTIDYYASSTYPIIITIDLTGLPYLNDPATIKLYQRSIHGTGPFTEVPVTIVGNLLTANVLSLGNFILGSDDPDNPLPVEFSSFTAAMTADLDAVTLTWVTQTESNLSGYYIYRGATDQLADATQINTLITATNTSQPHTYTYNDTEIQASTTYWYWIQVVEMDGTTGFHGPVSLTVPTGGPDAPPVIPLITDISNTYPNPFAANLHVDYGLKKPGHVVMQVTNAKGQVVRRLFSGDKAAGTYDLVWDGKDDNAKDCTSGVYFLRMTVGSKAYSRKVILVK